jgi:hypothetical protein
MNSRFQPPIARFLDDETAMVADAADGSAVAATGSAERGERV